MTPPKTPRSSAEILHIKNAPLSRAERDGLLAAGVTVTHLTQDELEARLRDQGESASTVERLAGAKLCILDTGTNLALAATILRIREGRPGRTIATTEHIGRISEGMAFSQTLAGGPPGHCDVIRDKEGLLTALREYGDPPLPVTAPAAALGSIVRPAKPLPYMGDPNGYTFDELYDPDHRLRGHTQLFGGRIAPVDLLSHGSAVRFRDVSSYTALRFLIQHLPSADLALFTGDEAGVWWESYVDSLRAQHPGPWRDLDHLREHTQLVEILLWQALCRDGGMSTLARIPAALIPIRDEAAARWGAASGELMDRMALGIADPHTRMVPRSTGAGVMEGWDVVPCEDPLATDTDPNRFRPTLTTLEVAHRYRPSPDVILLARERWGGRPYQTDKIAFGLESFVSYYPPTSAAELEGWVRVLQTLPAGRMRTRVLLGMNKWPRLEEPIIEAWGPYLGVDPNPNIVPYFDHKGVPQPWRLERIESIGLRVALAANEQKAAQATHQVRSVAPR